MIKTIDQPVTGHHHHLLHTIATLVLAVGASIGSMDRKHNAISAESARVPNIILILADDLGYGDVGCFGQQQIRTPNIDRLAAEGMRLTDMHAGGAVCIPSRSCLLTGLHSGHTRQHGSNEHEPLQESDITVARVLRDAGYTTACIGKWEFCDDHDGPGAVYKHGWDYYFGEPNQTTVHSYYLPCVWEYDRDGSISGKSPDTGLREVPIPENAGGKRKVYSHDLLTAAALRVIDAKAGKPKPFFLYLPYTIPHANIDPPDNAPYAKEDWPAVEKDYAAMITRMDSDIGKIMARLQQHGVDGQTIVFFTSDNGPTGSKKEGHKPEFFHSAGPLRGIKATLYEGGIREPTAARWPGHIAPGSVSQEPLAFCDFLPMLAALAAARAPEKIDGISFLPALLGKPQPHHEFLYWETPKSCAVRLGDWKAIATGGEKSVELYNLKDDLGEQTDVADKHPEIVAQARVIFKTAHTGDTPGPYEGKPAEKVKKKKRAKQ
jgi:arylsulfatase A-like enzyme